MSITDHRGDHKSGEGLSSAISAYRDLMSNLDTGDTPPEANELGVEFPLEFVLKQIPAQYVEAAADLDRKRSIFIAIPDLLAQLRKGKVVLMLTALADCIPAAALKQEAYDATDTQVVLPLADVVRVLDPALLKSGAQSQSKDVGGKYNLATLRDPFRRAKAPETPAPGAPPLPPPVPEEAAAVPAQPVAPALAKPVPPPPPQPAPVAPPAPKLTVAPPPPPPTMPIAPAVPPAPMKPVAPVETPRPVVEAPKITVPIASPVPIVAPVAPVKPATPVVVEAPVRLAPPTPIVVPVAPPAPVPSMPVVAQAPESPKVVVRHEVPPPIRTPTFTGAELPEPIVAALKPEDMIEAGALGSVNVNTADADQLLTIPGIEHDLANRIISLRLEQGPFSSVFDLYDRAALGRNLFRRITGMAYSTQRKHRAIKLTRRLGIAPAKICDLNVIAEAMAKAKGISGCVICDKEGLIVAEHSVGPAAEAISAIAADLIAQASRNMAMVGLTVMNSISISIEGQMFTIAKSGELHLTVVHDSNRITGSRLKLIHLAALELEWAFSRRVYAG